MHGSNLANLRNIIAQQINDHEIFSAVFLIALQKCFCRSILSRIHMSGLGAFHWPRFNSALSIRFEKQLG